MIIIIIIIIKRQFILYYNYIIIIITSSNKTHSQGNAGSTHPIGNAQEPDGKRQARAVDKLSRKMFPLSFFVFNIIYWVFYFVQPFQDDEVVKN